MNILPDDDLPFDASMLDRLAMVAIRVGLNLQPGQDLIITGPVEALPLIRRISAEAYKNCLLYTSPSPRDRTRSRMPSSA